MSTQIHDFEKKNSKSPKTAGASENIPNNQKIDLIHEKTGPQSKIDALKLLKTSQISSQKSSQINQKPQKNYLKPKKRPASHPHKIAKSPRKVKNIQNDQKT